MDTPSACEREQGDKTPFTTTLTQHPTWAPCCGFFHHVMSQHKSQTLPRQIMVQVLVICARRRGCLSPTGVQPAGGYPSSQSCYKQVTRQGSADWPSDDEFQSGLIESQSWCVPRCSLGCLCHTSGPIKGLHLQLRVQHLVASLFPWVPGFSLLAGCRSCPQATLMPLSAPP